MPGIPLFLMGKLAFRGGVPLFVDMADDPEDRLCCCGEACACCEKRLIGVVYTLGGVQSTVDCVEGDCSNLNGSYTGFAPTPPNLPACGATAVGNVPFCGISGPDIGPSFSCLIICVEDFPNPGDVTLGINVDGGNIDGQADWSKEVVVSGPKPVDCTALNGDVPLTFASTPIFCDWSAATMSVELLFA